MTTEVLNPSDFEFRYVVYKFNQTLNGRVSDLNDIRKTVQKVKKLGSNFQMGRVKSVTKIFNKLVHKEVKNKLEILMTKHEDKIHPLDLMKHLFHGTDKTDPA